MSSATERLVTEPPTSGPVPAPARGRRLAWLDALRGFAALMVVFDHMGTLVLQHVRDLVYNVMDTGEFGVFVFFLVSGYIIPASLERKGSVRSFWVSRAFRLWPLYALGIGFSILAYKTGFGAIHGAETEPKTWAYSLPLMMSNMLDGANVPNVIWTLSFEMVFYLLVTALFTYRVHRKSASYALIAVLAALLLGGLFPISGLNHLHLFGHVLGSRRVAILADAGIFVGLGLAVTGFRIPRYTGVLLAAATGVVLLLFNTSYPSASTGLVILALMFTGTMLYRAERGDFPWNRAIAIAVLVFLLAMAAGLWHGPGWAMSTSGRHQWDVRWVVTLAVSGAVFALGMSLRNKPVPRALAWLGLVSYSVYLLHPIILNAYRSIGTFHQPHPFPIQILLAAGILAVVLICSAVTYYLVESPMQKWGHKFARYLQNRFGSDAIEAPAVTPDAPSGPQPAPAVPDAPAVAAGDPQAAAARTDPDKLHENSSPAEADRGR